MSKGYATETPQPQRKREKESIEKASFLFSLCGCGGSVAISSALKLAGLI
jgi:hypothetical protein